MMNIVFTVLSNFSLTVDECNPQSQASTRLYFSFLFIITLLFFLKQRIVSAVRRLEAGDGGPPVDMLLLAQPLIDIERAAGEERTGPLLANLCFNQRV